MNTTTQTRRKRLAVGSRLPTALTQERTQKMEQIRLAAMLAKSNMFLAF